MSARDTVELDFAPGIVDIGTKLMRRKTWVDGNRVRFRKGVAEPIGGWTRAKTAAGVNLPAIGISTPDLCCGIHAWLDNSGSIQRVFGLNGGLKAINASGAITNITPAGFSPNPLSNAGSLGYGSSFYGINAYGVPPPAPLVVYSPPFFWEFDVWGEDLLAGEIKIGGKLYAWTPGTAQATIVTNAPTGFSCFTVTNERIVMTGGSLLNPRLIQWSASEDRTLWIPALTNQAGNFTLAGGGPLLRMGKVQDFIVIISTTDAHIARYIKVPYVYSFDRIAENCGAPSARSIVFTKDFAVWPGDEDFFIFDGQIRLLECPIYETIRRCIDGLDANKIFAWDNTPFDEIWWHFPCPDVADEVLYVAWNYRENTWHKGRLDRVAAFASQILPNPIMVGSDLFIYNHELAGVFPGVVEDDVFILSGPFSVSNNNQYLSAIYPDLELAGELELSLHTYAMAGNSVRVAGPYNVSLPYDKTQPIPMRAFGHNIQLNVKALSGTWRMGQMRAAVIGGGPR